MPYPDFMKPVRKWGKRTVLERFMSKVKRCDKTGCWLWVGAKTKAGYGKFTVRKTTFGAHRFMFSQANGTIGEGLTLDHLCRVRHCVNPQHMEAVSIGVNILRGNTLQAKNREKTHCVNGHPFSFQNTRIVYGWRQCRECMVLRKEAARRKAGIKKKGRYLTKWHRRTQRILP